jgi:hypothetical protein
MRNLRATHGFYGMNKQTGQANHGALQREENASAKKEPGAADEKKLTL